VATILAERSILKRPGSALVSSCDRPAAPEVLRYCLLVSHATLISDDIEMGSSREALARKSKIPGFRTSAVFGGTARG